MNARSLAVAGIAAAIAGALIVVSLHLVAPSADLDPTRRTISHYALLDNGWVFTTALLVLAAGSVAILVALVRARLTPAAGPGAAALALWCVSLPALAYFPKHNWSLGPSVEGHVHRMVGVVAFLSLPAAAIVIGRSWLAAPDRRSYGLASVRFGVLSLLCFAPIVVAFGLQPVTGVAWWRAIPLGAVERVLATCEVATLLTLGWSALCTRPPRQVPAR